MKIDKICTLVTFISLMTGVCLAQSSGITGMGFLAKNPQNAYTGPVTVCLSTDLPCIVRPDHLTCGKYQHAEFDGKNCPVDENGYKVCTQKCVSDIEGMTDLDVSLRLMAVVCNNPNYHADCVRVEAKPELGRAFIIKLWADPKYAPYLTTMRTLRIEAGLPVKPCPAKIASPCPEIDKK